MAPRRLSFLEHFLQLKDVYVLFALLQLSKRPIVVIDDGADRSLYTRAHAVNDIVAGHPLVHASIER